MKKRTSKQLALILGAMGLAGCLMRYFLYRVGLDEKGLLTPMHPLGILTWVLTGAAVVLALVCTWRQEKTCPALAVGTVPGIGSLILAAALLLTGIGTRKANGLLAASIPLCYAAAASMAGAAYAQFRGRRPFFLLRVIPCLFFAFYLIGSYQLTRGIPQMEDYVAPVCAIILSMLLSYQQAAWDLASTEGRQIRLAAGLTLYFGLISLSHSWMPVLCLGSSLWALTLLLSCQEERA